MKRFLKKIFNKFTLSLTIALVCVCSLFAMTKTYAYDYNDNTNQLVGNNIIDSLTYSNATYYNSGVITMPTQISINNNVITYNLDGTSFSSGYVNVFFTDNNNYSFSGKNFNIVVLFESENLSGSVGNGTRNYYIEYGFGNNSDNITQFGFSTQSNQTFWYQTGSHSFVYSYINNNIYNANYYGFKFRLGTSGNTNFSLSGTIKVSFFVFNDNFNSNYLINNNQAFVPYSSIEQLQQDYNTLLGQYNELRIVYQQYQDTHSHSNTQYNDLVSQINTLQGQLSQLQLQYDTYVATHSYTDAQYNELNTQYQTLTNNYTTLQNNYDTLQAQYDLLLNQIQYGSFSYLDTSYLYLLNSGTWIGPEEWNFNKLLNDGVLSYNVLNLVVIENASSYYNKPTKIEFIFNNLPVNQLLLDMRNIAMQIDINFDNNYIYNNNYNGSVTLNYEYLNNNFSYFDKVTYIEKITFYVDNNNGSKIYLNNDFANGFTAGKNSMYSFYENATKQNQDLLLTIDNLNTQVSQLQSSLSSLQSSYNSLQTSYNNYMNGDNFTSLFFTIAETPFASFKQIWNVDFLGVNLSGFVTGLLFIGLMIWLVKKIF